MNIDNEHNADFSRLTEEIRSLGTPFQSPEPDDRYFANFRVRVMERVEEKRGLAGWMDRVREFISGHVLGTGLAGAAAAVVVSLTVILHPFSASVDTPNQIAAISSPAAPAPAAKDLYLQAPLPPTVTAPTAQPQVTHDKPVASNVLQPSVEEPQQDIAMAEDAPGEMADQPMMMHGDEDGPVNLNDLSARELESVLSGIQELR